MSRKMPNTPRSRIRACLRQLWLRSRERAAALKRDKYTCVRCGVKQSKAKGKEVFVQVHHLNGIPNWETVIDVICAHILCNPSELITLCQDCHEKETPNDK